MYTCRPLQTYRSVSTRTEKKFFFYERSQQLYFKYFVKKSVSYDIL